MGKIASVLSSRIKDRCSEICNQLAKEPQLMNIVNEMITVRKEICGNNVKTAALMEKYDNLRLNSQCYAEEKIYEQAVKDTELEREFDTLFDTLP